eukprot:gene6745-8068_t
MATAKHASVTPTVSGRLQKRQRSKTLHEFTSQESTVGAYLSRRLEEVGVDHFFSVPGDYNLVLLDQLLLNKHLQFVGCCNELNAGYAADGYARIKKVGCVVVTFTVGGLSVINAIAGAYSDNLPVICISGGPNTNDFASNRVLHHTIGLTDFAQQSRCFREVTSWYEVITHPEDAPRQIDKAIEHAIMDSKPVYIEIACNIAGAHIALPVPLALKSQLSNHESLTVAADKAAEFLNRSTKPVIVLGVKARASESSNPIIPFMRLVESSGYPFAIMPNAKGLVNEEHPQFIGTYWGQVSTNSCCETVESADAYIFVGPVMNDYTTYGSIGWSVGASLGMALACAEEQKRVVLLIGDGSFQMTAQELSTMIRYQTNPIIFLINNNGYTIEVWDYAKLVDVFNGEEGNGVGMK